MDRVRLLSTAVQTVVIPFMGALLASYLVIVHKWPIDPIAGTIALGMMATPVAHLIDRKIAERRTAEVEALDKADR